MRQVKFYLEDEYYQTLRQKAEEQGVSISSLVRELVLKELGLLNENSIEKRINELENDMEKMKEQHNKIIKTLKKHGELINDLYNCCSQVNYYWAMSKRAQRAAEPLKSSRTSLLPSLLSTISRTPPIQKWVKP